MIYTYVLESIVQFTYADDIILVNVVFLQDLANNLRT